MQPRGRRDGLRSEEMFERDNDRLVEDMSAKVAQLKSVSVAIGLEVREQNKELTGMGSDFDSAGGMFGTTLKRLGLMSRAGHHSWMCYMFAFILFIVFVTYYLIR